MPMMQALMLPLLRIAAIGTPLPSTTQLDILSRERGLSQFMHFSVNQFDVKNHTQHNCVGYGPCLPASLFNPTNLSTDQWVQTAVAFGAEEICLTAHHEGGFALWDTQYSNYSVMHSPYGKDVVAQFVASCKKYGVKPCYYFGPNANGFFVTHNYSADQFVAAQLGEMTELLTKYGNDYVSRLWIDHWDRAAGKCWNGRSPKVGPNPVLCPPGAFPTYSTMDRFIKAVRKLSPSTIVCPGPDCDTGYRHLGLPAYPKWYPCVQTTVKGTGQPLCTEHVKSNSTSGFHPYTYNSAMTGGWFINGPADDPKTQSKFWNATRMWHVYMATAGIGSAVSTLNAPPSSTGQIPAKLAGSMATFGTALKALLKPVTASARATNLPRMACNNTTLATLHLAGGHGGVTPAAAVQLNALIAREDLSQGQRISAYAIDYLPAGNGHDQWEAFERLPERALNCTPPRAETNMSCLVGTGVHGLSVGSRVIDFVPVTAATKVRFRCLASLGGDVKLASFSAHRGAGPEGPLAP